MKEGDWPFPITKGPRPMEVSPTGSFIVDIWFTDGTALLNFSVENGAVKNVPLKWVEEKAEAGVQVREIAIIGRKEGET